MLVAHYISEAVTDVQPPRWPQPFTGSGWESWVEILSKPDCNAADATRFRKFWCDVTDCELRASAGVATLLRSWRDMLNLAAPVEERERAVLRIKRHLDAHWGIRITEPPQMADIDRAAVRLTRRYDLLPREVREIGPV